jgi:hypothetical protein
MMDDYDSELHGNELSGDGAWTTPDETSSYNPYAGSGLSDELGGPPPSHADESSATTPEQVGHPHESEVDSLAAAAVEVAEALGGIIADGVEGFGAALHAVERYLADFLDDQNDKPPDPATVDHSGSHPAVSDPPVPNDSSNDITPSTANPGDDKQGPDDTGKQMTAQDRQAITDHMQDQQEDATLLSNLSAMRHSTAMSMIQNIR